MKDKPCSEAVRMIPRYQCIVTEKPVHKVAYYMTKYVDYCDYWMPDESDTPIEKPVRKENGLLSKEDMLADFKRLSEEKKKGVSSERIQHKGEDPHSQQEGEV